MERTEAIATFTTLQSMTVKVEGDPDSEFVPDREGWEEPLFDVRLDAGSEEDRSNGKVDRTWRIRVSYSKTGWGDEYVLRKVIDVAEEAGLRVLMQNDGLELT